MRGLRWCAVSAGELAAFWLRAFWTFGIRATWDALPGPWWVKALLIVVVLAIPGPQDELLLIAFTAACRRFRARRAAQPISI